MEHEVFLQIGIALGLGLLVGLQRQHSDATLAGLRTFPLVTVAGTIGAFIDQRLSAGGWVIAAGWIAVGAAVIVGSAMAPQRREGSRGLTTETAFLLMYAVGALTALGESAAAIAVGVGVAALLQFKPELHGFAARLGDEDLRAIMTFALISGIALPALPEHAYELPLPFGAIRPREIWLMVVLMVGISLGAYLAYRFLGGTASLWLGGILGGAISSTATTWGCARRARHAGASVDGPALVILIASAVSLLRVLAEIAVAAPDQFWSLSPPVGSMFVGAAAAAGISSMLGKPSPHDMPPPKNPTELRAALVFALLYAGVLMALEAADHWLGEEGTYLVALLSGATDMDAITLSTARLVQRSTAADGLSAELGSHLIVTAALSNLVFKAALAGIVGGARLSLRIAATFALPFLIGIGWLVAAVL